MYSIEVRPDRFWKQLDKIQGIPNQLDYIFDIIDDAVIDERWKFIDNVLDKAPDISEYPHEVLLTAIVASQHIQSNSFYKFYQRVWNKFESDKGRDYAREAMPDARKS
jgi:hypothetical protein